MKHPKLMWTGIILGGLVVVVVGVWLGLSASTSRELREQIAAIRARGEPVYLKDLAREPVPDELNAVTYYRRAAGHPLVSGSDGDEEMRRLADAKGYWANRDFRREHREEFERIRAVAEAEVLPIVAQARGLSRSDWGIEYGVSPAIEFDPFTDGVGDAMRLGKLLSAVAMQAAEDGDIKAACRAFQDARGLAKTVFGEPILIAYLTGLGVESISPATLEQIAPELVLNGPGEREAIEELLSSLVDDSIVREGLRSAMIGERACHIGVMERLKAGEEMHTALPDFYVSHNERVIIRYMNQALEAAGARTWPEAKRRLPDEDVVEKRGKIGRILNLFADILIPSSSGVFKLHFRHLAERQMAATALAIRLYELDHGKRPKTLDEIVPDYLPAVPDDPFSAGPQPIHYLPDADPPLLYSVGENGEDDGGEFAVDEEGGYDWGESPDQVFFLNGLRPDAPMEWQFDKPAEAEAPTQPATRHAPTGTAPATAPAGDAR